MRKKKVLDDLKEMSRYWKFREKALISLCEEITLEEAKDLS
jgi:hypothetical protein